MDIKDKTDDINGVISNQKSNFDYSISETCIILAAGHGKRIKSKTSKMLHKIWEKPTVERVYDACANGLENSNTIFVVGVKAVDVINAIGEKDKAVFAYQEEQKGTGHAVQIALEKIDRDDYEGTVYILPGDMGLIDESTIATFKKQFINSEADMMVLTGLYEGNPENNNYGRIIRVKEEDDSGNSSGSDNGKVVEIIEHKDILGLDESEPYVTSFHGNEYSFTKEELINNNEFNSGVYAFNFKHLNRLINNIDSDNIQGEIYITDLISIFNKDGLTVRAVHPHQQHVLMGFNNKSVLREMESIARHMAYNKLKDILEIEDPEDFFIHEDVVNTIIELDKKGQPLDIKIGKGSYIGAGVKINYNLSLMKNAYIKGNIEFGKNVLIRENTHLSTFKHQKMILEDNVEIFWGDIIKGNTIIGKNSRIESSVNMTGSDDYPMRIGKNVTIKGTSYLFGSIVEEGILIEHSILIKKRIKRELLNGEVKKVSYYLPKPEGIELISDV